MADKPPQPERRNLSTLTVDELREEVERQRLLVQATLLESSLNYFDNWVDPREPLMDSPDFWWPLGQGEGLVPRNIDSRKRGEVLPVFLNELQLKLIRDQSRQLRAYNEYAINAIENRVSYLVGKGFQYEVALKPEEQDQAGEDLGLEEPEGLPGVEPPDPLCQAAQRVIDEFIERTDWGELEQEIVDRCDTDGEAFLRFFHVGNGFVEVRIVEPEHVRSPDEQTSARSFGVETDPEDVEDVKGYWITENPDVSMTPTFVPANEILHIKINVRRNAKRGLPTLMPVRKNLDRAEKLLRNMSILAQVQATFALIRKHKNYSASAIQAFQQGQADAQWTTPITGSTRYMQQFLPGTVLDSTDNTEYEFPSAHVAAGEFVAILQAELRAVASRLVMPEYMLTADASNANFASTMVAEAPSTKNFERCQQFYARKFGDGTYGSFRQAGVMWRVLAVAVEHGRLPQEVIRRCKVQAEGPSLVARDKSQETNRAQTLNNAGVLSKSTWAKWEGLDWDQEQQQVAKEQPPQQQAPAEQAPPDQGFGLDDGGEPPPDEGGFFESVKGVQKRYGPEAARAILLATVSLLETGFTGVVHDKNGAELHYQDGKRIAAPGSDGPAPKGNFTSDHAADHLAYLLANPSKITDAHVAGVERMLAHVDPKETEHMKLRLRTALAKAKGPAKQIADLVLGKKGKPAPVTPKAKPAAGIDMAKAKQAALAAFDKIDAATGGHNFVSFVDLRKHLADAGLTDRKAQDQLLLSMRAKEFTLSPVEGRHGIDADTLAAGIREPDGALLGYVSRRVTQ